MSVNPIEEKTTPNTTGSLEELFRHHLGEEAAVPPRPMLWEQIDNSLLLRQNEQYRRRLVATRWVAAASLLLATLAGTGWWAGRTGLMGGATVATARRSGMGPNATASSIGKATAIQGPRAGAQAARLTNADGLAVARQNNGANAGEAAAKANLATTASAALRGEVLASAMPDAAIIPHFGGTMPVVRAERLTRSGHNEVASNATATKRLTNTSQTLPAGAGETAGAPLTAALATARPATATGTGAAEGATGTALTGMASAGGSTAAATNGTAIAMPALATVVPAAAVPAAAGESAALAAHPAALGLAETPALPGSLAVGPEPAALAATPHQWRYSASYAAGTFNPNINFSRAGIEPAYGYNPVLGPAELSEAAATEYRQNLRSGLSQRVALLATRHLRGHWSLSTGAEYTKASARSASTVSFLGEQVADGGQSVGQGTQRTTDFSYTLAGVPLELRYANTAKRGWSLYGRLGGVVSALLGNRSEVAGRPESTQTYAITSASTPYRRLTSSVRGGAGARFSAGTGHWGFTLGPVAEVGLVSLNAHPVQSYFAQSHPYTLGLEAGVEFGR